jgi:amidohydrolase
MSPDTTPQRACDEIAAQEPALVELRRALHAAPELSRQEHQTTQALAARLRALGCEPRVRPEGNGLWADLAPPGFDPARHPTVLLRADIDALPILEETGRAFASRSPGVMHACGHDMHTACVMGAGLGLRAALDALPGRVRLLFQHNEESHPGGADEMVAQGALDGVSWALSLHCDPELDCGRVGLRPGPLTAAADTFEVEIHGSAGHTARPHHSVDAAFVAVQVANALYQCVGRCLDARDPAVLAIGALHTGQAPNVIPGRATLTGTIRTLSREQRAKVEPLLRQVAQGTAAAWNASATLTLTRGAPSVLNDPALVELLRQEAAELLGPQAIYEIPLPSMGGEDFSHYLEHVPGAMFRLGTAAPQAPKHLLHSPRFDPDERAIALGAKLLARAALRLLRQAHCGG